MAMVTAEQYFPAPSAPPASPPQVSVCSDQPPSPALPHATATNTRNSHTTIAVDVTPPHNYSATMHPDEYAPIITQHSQAFLIPANASPQQYFGAAMTTTTSTTTTRAPPPQQQQQYINTQQGLQPQTTVIQYTVHSPAVQNSQLPRQQILQAPELAPLPQQALLQNSSGQYQNPSYVPSGPMSAGRRKRRSCWCFGDGY